jgi:hypothetical protein
MVVMGQAALRNADTTELQELAPSGRAPTTEEKSGPSLDEYNHRANQNVRFATTRIPPS